MRTSVNEIKKAQRESVLLKLVSELFAQQARDEQALQGLAVSRVELSQKQGLCTVYFYTPDGKEAFDKALETLKLYKPSLRKAVAHQLQGRYVPDLLFVYDAQYEKIFRIEELLQKVAQEEPVEDTSE